MISVGIDVSKGKSTVCIMQPCGKVLRRPFDVKHDKSELEKLAETILGYDDETRVIMEATGIYHLPILTFLQSKGIFTSVINPYEMKQYRCHGLRKVKNDKRDAMMIANFGIDYWYRLVDFKTSDDTYSELKLLVRQYNHYMVLHVNAMQERTHMLDYTMPGIKNLMNSYNEASGKDKLGDFVNEFWHYDNITCMSEDEFIVAYNEWAIKKEYRQSQEKAKTIYTLALNSIPTLPSKNNSVKMLVREAVRVLKEIDHTLRIIITQMRELAKTLPEYSVVREMGGIGDVLAPKIIAEIGDVRRFHNGKALVAYAGVDAPPYQSGQFTGTNRKISKRGSASLRKIAYEIMRCLKTTRRENDPVYCFIVKKEKEGKNKKLAKVAGINKFLRIYYARVKEIYQQE